LHGDRSAPAAAVVFVLALSRIGLAAEPNAVAGEPSAPSSQPSPPRPPPAPYVPAVATSELVAGFGANLSVGYAFLATPPDMTLTTPDGGAMPQFSADPLRHLAAMQMVSASISVFYRTASPFVIPLLGFEFGFPVSTGYPANVALGTGRSALTWLRGGPTYRDGLDILGAGVSFSSGTFRFDLDVIPGFRFITTTGAITQGLLTIDAEAHDYSFSLHADAGVCVGAKAAFSVCAYGTPYVFEFGRWMNGAAFGLRVETN
jgi:hypothetical protein